MARILTRRLSLPRTLLALLFIALVVDIVYMWQQNQKAIARINALQSNLDAASARIGQLESTDFATQNAQLKLQLKQTTASLTAELKQQSDTYSGSLKQIHDAFTQAATLYEGLVDLKEGAGKRSPLDTVYASVLRALADNKIADAEKALADLNTKLQAAEAQAAAAGVSAVAAANLPASNTPPANGYARQKVHIDSGDFIVSIIAADLSSAKVIVDTASDTDCANNCPVMPLATYAARSGAFAAINGVYFCPASYPTCAGKTNSYDQLIMNKNKVYFNSANNVYSLNPAAVIGPGTTVRFLSRAEDWGRDTGVDAVISNNPPILQGSQVVAASTDPKLVSRGYRGFISHINSKVYIGFVHNATITEGALVLKAMGMQDAVNLDSGGSTALWFGGYKLGPGRDLPMGILFVRR